MTGPTSPYNTGANGNSTGAFVSPGSSTRQSYTGGGRGGGRRGIPRQRTLTRNYNFSPNYNPPHIQNSPPNGDNSDAPPQAPILQERSVRTSEAFFVNAGDLKIHSRKRENKGSLANQSILTYDGVIKIGGQSSVRPAPIRGVGKGNKTIPGRCNLEALRQVNSPNTTDALPVVQTTTGTDTPSAQGRVLRQTTLGGWYTTSKNKIDPTHKDSQQLLFTETVGLGRDEAALQHSAAIDQVLNTRNARVLEANVHSTPFLTPSQRVGEGAQDIIFFEHININGINPHDKFSELTNTMGILDTMEAGVYSIVETQWDTTCPKFCKFIRSKIKEHDTYAKASFGSNTDESFLTSWKPGGTLVGASGRWASRVAKSGTDELGRWSWMDLRGKKGKTIRVISAYRVSQDHPSTAGETISCKQQVRSLMIRGVKNHNPKKRFLEDLALMITSWRNNSVGGEIILMADMNEFIGEKKLYTYFVKPQT